MMHHQTLEHRFVRNVPRELSPGVFYISLDYATAVHLCCCGCGDRVVTPFTPTDWRITFDGETISLHPSVGNWNQKCRSHYVIQQSRVLEAGVWTNAQIQAERLRDRKAKAEYYNVEENKPLDGPSQVDGHVKRNPDFSVWSQIKSWFIK
jgi:hypothetical protein